MAPVRERTLQRVLRTNLEVRPDRPALSDASISLTHAELWERARRCAGGFAEVGVTAGDTVLLMLDNSVDYFVVVAGLSFLGATSVPTNTAYKGTILEHVIRNSGCTAAVVEDHYSAIVQGAAGDRMESLVVRGLVDRSGTGRGVPLANVLDGEGIDPVEVGAWDRFAIMYTSGTTGLSKGAVTSQAGAYTVAYLPDIQGPHDDSDIGLVVCPMFHATGLLGGAYGALAVGASAHIVPHFSATSFWDDVNKVGATTTVLVGAMCAFLMQQPPSPDDKAHSLRKIYANPRPPFVGEMMDRFGIVTATSYGGTEAGCVTTNLDAPRSMSIGRLRDGWELRLVDEHDLDVPDGEPGEAIVRAKDPWVISTEYVNNPEATATTWRNGWFHTGDLLRRDPDGRYYFVDRVKDCIKRRGENISSLEVEREVRAHPEVLECAAVGVGDAGFDQEVLVLVALVEGSELSEDDLVRFLIERMPYYSVPRYVSYVSDFPRTPTGKVRKTELRELPSDAWDREAAGIVVSRPNPRSR